MRNENNPTVTRRVPTLTQPASDPVPVKHDRVNGARPRKRLRTLADLDGRTHAAINARRLVAALSADLGGDLSTAERELVKRAALLGAIVENYEVDWLENRPADLAIYGRLVDRQRRVLEALGLDRRPVDVTPSNNGIPPHLREMIKRVKQRSRDEVINLA